MTDDQAISEQADLMQYVPKVHFEQIPRDCEKKSVNKILL